MWTNDDYEALKTFQEVIDEQGQAAVFGTTTLDEATQQSIINWFKFRKVSDNERFVDYFQRILLNYETQYTSYLRVQTIQFDPLVTSYLERLINRDGTESRTGTGSRSNTTKETGSETGSGSGTSKTVGDVTTTASDNTSTTSSGTTNATNSGNQNVKAMNAQLPQSSTGAGSGLPSAMNWNYATAQDESQTVNSGSSNDSRTGNASSTGSSRSNSDSTSMTTNTESNTRNNTRNSTTTESENSNDNATNSEVVKERSTGRNGETPELLRKAVSYITQTNCFFWLVDKLEAAFMANY